LSKGKKLKNKKWHKIIKVFGNVLGQEDFIHDVEQAS
jgi:hypothetical protein